jgi:hypothetical protein
MRPCLVTLYKPVPSNRCGAGPLYATSCASPNGLSGIKSWLRVGLIAVVTFALSGWTCSAIIGFNSCLGIPAVPQITSLSPNLISQNAASVVLIVIGSNFVPQSHILWNGNTLATTFVDSNHLEATITQQTFAQFGGSPGGNVLISVNSAVSSAVVGCPIPGSTATLVLGIT